MSTNRDSEIFYDIISGCCWSLKYTFSLCMISLVFSGFSGLREFCESVITYKYFIRAGFVVLSRDHDSSDII